VYDGDGNRVSETVGGVTTNYLVDTLNPTGYAQVVDELQSGVVTRTYSYGLERISEKQAAGASFYGYDGHGSVRQLTDATGTVTDSYDYDGFGNLISQMGATPNNYLFASEQYDPALGLYYNRARYLNTTTGRFWSMDSVDGEPEDPASLHRYAYASGSPVDRADPLGSQDFTLIGATAYQATATTIDVTPVVQGAILFLFILANFTTLLDDDPRFPNSMRVQLQEGIDTTFYGKSEHNTAQTGVTLFQVRNAMQELYNEARADASFGRNKFPYNALEDWLFSSVISISIKLGTYPPGGISGLQRNFIQETVEYRKKEYRLDVDNLSGHNLRQ
jgi:RHS repeat-associated protein